MALRSAATQLHASWRAGPRSMRVPTLPCRPIAVPARKIRCKSAALEGIEIVQPEATAQGAPKAKKSSRTIILAVDDTPESEYAVEWATQQLHRPGDTFQLVHCLPSLQPGRMVAVPGGGLLMVPRIDPVLVAEKKLADVESTLARKLRTRLDKSGVDSSFQLLSGPAAAAAADKASIGVKLCSAAKAAGAAAVVIASASKGGLMEALQGSVAASLVHHCEVPVVVLHRPKASGQKAPQALRDSDVTWLLSATSGDIDSQPTPAAAAAAAAGPGPGQMPAAQAKVARNLVVAVDDSEEGYAAVTWVVQNLRRSGDKLHLLHVVPALPAHMTYSLAPDGMMYSLPLPQLEDAQVEEGQWRTILMERLSPLLQSNHIDFQVDILTDFGSDPMQGIAGTVVATAEKLEAAALVVCGHSKGTVADWLLGSVSDFAAHHAGVPVVVLHGPGFVQSKEAQ